MALGPAAAAGGGEEMAAGRALPPQRPPQAEPPRSPLRGGGTVRGGRWTGSLRSAGRAGGPRVGGGWPEVPQLFSSGPTGVPGDACLPWSTEALSPRHLSRPRSKTVATPLLSAMTQNSSWRVHTSKFNVCLGRGPPVLSPSKGRICKIQK